MSQYSPATAAIMPVSLFVLLLASTNLAAAGSEYQRMDPARGHPAQKSIGIFVGNELTEDGSTLLGGFGHEPSSHWIEIIPRQEHAEGATVEVGVTEEASIPGELTEIPQAEVTYKHIASHYSEFAGFPPPLTNGGLNEHGVAARDIWAPSREELVEIAEDNAPQEGPNYSDLARAAMERATTAREAVEVVGRLMDEHGFSTYGGNSHLFADEDEGWVFINYAAKGLWAAERIPADEIRVSYFGYINKFPADPENHDDYMASDNLIDFAREQGWWDGEGDWLNLQEVYGTPFPGEEMAGFYPAFYEAGRNPPEREAELEDMVPISLEDLIAYVRDPRWSTDFTGYGQVAHIRPDVRDELQTLWTAVTSGITTPFVPLTLATESVPPEFSQHRYMTADSSSHFVDPDFAHLEATRYATRTFKRLLYYTCERPEAFLHPVTAELEAFEQELISQRESVEQRARRLYEEDGPDVARDYLTKRAHSDLLDSLNLGQRLVAAIERETRERFGIRMPEGKDVEGETAPATSQHMAEQGWGAMVHCYDAALDEYPREHGIYSDHRGLVQ